MRLGVLVTAAGLLGFALAALAAGSADAYDAALAACLTAGGVLPDCQSQAGSAGWPAGRAVALAIGAVSLNALIVGPWFIARTRAAWLRRFLPRWLPW